MNDFTKEEPLPLYYSGSPPHIREQIIVDSVNKLYSKVSNLELKEHERQSKFKQANNEIKITKKPLQEQLLELCTKVELINQRVVKLEKGKK